MIPGTAIGVLVGDLLFFWMAFSMGRRKGRYDITAMPLGLDTPSTFGMVFFVLGPAFLYAKQTLPSVDEAARYAWHIGICSIFISGLFKLVCACGSNWVRRVMPRAGLLGSLTAIALVLISFLPLLEILHQPVVGLVALAIILTTLVARVPLPLRMPGALGALLVGGVLFYLMQTLGVLGAPAEPLVDPRQAMLPTGWLSAFRFEWFTALRDTLNYLPIVIPFALATVIGGIDCTESAAAAGDDFDTGQVIAVEALATLVASMCGGVIQSTPYIGHPAYKAMGARSGYTLATALFVGGAGLIGYFGYLYVDHPQSHGVSDPDLCRAGDYGAEFPSDAPAALSRVGDRLHPGVGRLGDVVRRQDLRRSLAGVCRTERRDAAGSRTARRTADDPDARQRLHCHQPVVGVGVSGADRPPLAARCSVLCHGGDLRGVWGHSFAFAGRATVCAVGRGPAGRRTLGDTAIRRRLRDHRGAAGAVGSMATERANRCGTGSPKTTASRLHAGAVVTIVPE